VAPSSKSPPSDGTATRKNTSRSILSYLRPHALDLFVGVLLLLVTNALDKAIPWFLKGAIDALSEGDIETVQWSAIVVFVIAAVMWFVRTASRIRVFNIGRDVEYELRNELLERIHHLGASFFRRMPTGDIMSRATNDLGQVRLLVGFGALNVVNSVFAYAGALGLMLALSPELTLWALVPLPFFAVATRYFSRAMFRMSRESQEALSTLSDRAQESIAGVRLVRAFDIEEHVERRFEDANQNALKRNMRLVALRGVMWPVLSSLSSIGTLVVIWRGGSMVLDKQLTIGEFAAFISYLGQLVGPTMAFGFLLSVVQRGRVSFARVREILDAKPDVEDRAGAKPATTEGEVTVQDLHFSYGDRKVLDGVSFEVSPQDSLAIVGRTGSGKSTIAALLPRLLDTPGDSVFLDGTDVDELELKSLRRAVGYAPQDTFLFSTTIERNVGFGLDDPSAPDAQERIRAATRDAAILDEIEEMPEGFETVVGERGVQLSGGQKQRIALARALLREPAVLVLDDPMSAVDARTERRILEALSRAGEGRTLVLVTNRVAAAALTKRIVILDRGRIVDSGTHEELKARGGFYATLCERQELEAELTAL
jgi:ATP-binding cassette subfamily B protein